ncbi:MAG TPA: wax ester/triacylglycerol synthase family O-acyltransferase [Solirubrobacteraceae bacterium]|nr:wax ester/triacylglycerol synthase family O-acyltransferase [Solirubrobacteraceae bacterium]
MVWLVFLVTEHLTPLDGTFLELEEVDESAHMHTGAVLVFDPQPSGAMPSLEEVCENLKSRLEQLPRYRQRLSEPHTGGLAWPEWQDDPEFDVRRHVARAALPAPGGDRELSEWSSGFFSQRLDRHRPLWEMALVEGLADGRWAIATKTHHCMVDGVGSVDVGRMLLDATADAAPAAPSSASGSSGGHELSSSDVDRPTSSAPGSLARLAHAWDGLLPTETIRGAARMGASGVLHPREALSSARAAIEVIVREELRGAPHTSLNVPIGTRRRFDVVRVPLADLKEIKGSLGGTVNDVVLTVTAAGLRALLESRGEELPDAGLRAMVPINIRGASEHFALGNRVSSLYVELPLAEHDLAQRYHETVARSESLKSQGRQAAGTTAVVELAGLAPPVLHAAMARALYATRLFNVTITNVPGPQQTLYGYGAALREIHPLVPLAAEHAVGVAIVSYDGNVFFGVVADRDAIPDLDVMLNALGASVAELLAVARAEQVVHQEQNSATATRPRRRPATRKADGAR